jgi:hypothetical protein
VKHPHWTRRLEEQAARIGIDLSDPGMPAGARDTLREAYRRIARALVLARAPCDRAVVWAGGEDLPACAGTVAGALYGTGPFDWLPDGSLAGVASREDVYSGGPTGTPVWTGPLWVLVDRGTASAAEELPAVLADNGAARVMGEPTFGAGCGYTNGGLPFTLPHSGLVVWMPDCVRYRRDGANEVEGVRPDVAIPWSELDGEERARALVRALAAYGPATEP